MTAEQTTPRPDGTKHQNLRHHAARRRAIARRQHEIVEKLEIAQALVDLGVDIIEAGFPIASPGDFEPSAQIADNIRGAVICGLARCGQRRHRPRGTH